MEILLIIAVNQYNVVACPKSSYQCGPNPDFTLKKYSINDSIQYLHRGFILLLFKMDVDYNNCCIYLYDELPFLLSFHRRVLRTNPFISNFDESNGKKNQIRNHSTISPLMLIYLNIFFFFGFSDKS